MKVGFVIEGAKELEANLATLGKRLEKKVIRGAVRDGQRPVLAAAKTNAKSIVGGEMGAKLAKSLQIRAPRRQYPGSYSLHVQIKPGVPEFFYAAAGAQTKISFKAGEKRRGKTTGISYIPAAIEYGHMTGSTYVPPIPFMRPAADSTRAETIRRFTNQLRIGLLREAIKARSV